MTFVLPYTIGMSTFSMVAGRGPSQNCNFCPVVICFALFSIIRTSNIRVFQIVLRGEGMENFAGGRFFLLGSGNLRRSDFDHSKFFQS